MYIILNKPKYAVFQTDKKNKRKAEIDKMMEIESVNQQKKKTNQSSPAKITNKRGRKKSTNINHKRQKRSEVGNNNLARNKESCYKCKVELTKTDNTWISCEKCDNKVCKKCLPRNFKYSEEYYCKNCLNK
jgi:hypothetical protein